MLLEYPGHFDLILIDYVKLWLHVLHCLIDLGACDLNFVVGLVVDFIIAINAVIEDFHSGEVPLVRVVTTVALPVIIVLYINGVSDDDIELGLYLVFESLASKELGIMHDDIVRDLNFLCVQFVSYLY